ncbi:MAG: DUF4824 family protein [Pirellulaceae bacterium]|jgi:hypothetical protein|nr:DUF4824 family protein [Pirellulaceae bacterium]
MKLTVVVAAAAIVVVSNAWALVTAWRNQSHADGGTLELTEREVPLLRVPWETTATQLELHWDVLSDAPAGDGPAAWLDAAKLAELGYDCRVALDDPQAREHYNSLPPVEVFVVLEYADEAWRKAQPRQETRTRLFVVDAGRDAARLREQYPGDNRHVIVRGIIRPFYQEHSIPDGAPLSAPRLRGWVQDVLPSRIFVPQPHGAALEEFRDQGPPDSEPAETAPRFAVTISWGSDYEPWVLAVRRLTP